MRKQGFGGQWIEICRVGKATDSKGVKLDLTRDMLATIVANYSAGNHDAPIVVGHPESDSAPAYGWTEELRLNGDVLEARFKETNEEFEQAVENGSYKKRSASFYLDPPNLRHIGFLGAQPPAIKGLQDIKFADGESFTFETFNLQETKMKDEDFDQLPDSTWEKIKAKLGLTDKKTDLGEGEAKTAGQPVQFTEASAKAMIAEAVTEATKAITTDFAEKLKEKDTVIETLTKKVDGQIAGGVRAEITSFVESIPAEKGKHFLKRIHIADFLESLAVADAADEKAAEAISFSEGEGTDKTEHKFSRLEYAKTLLQSIAPMVEFGEKFGNIVATKEADAMVNLDRVKEMGSEMGIKEKTVGGDK